ncbi:MULTISPECIES: RraA family protein [unclassified Chelatococcus]|uniref:RraA family protein n=1 Tax=unclassified Chelatococcus TaxID=2638111 RepID=UPI001BCD82A7|nr:MULTISPECIES: RraA family protein [unclassified Chelatococcus]MBS7695965.1 RraA family protein [Chelatococcus sp. YT9]MBX3555660.1 RraA family protein [Chelatococcus sp.]
MTFNVLPGTLDILDVIERYRRLYTGLVYDIMDEMGLPNQSLATDIRPLRDDMVIAGPAFTVQGIADPTGDPGLRERRIKMFGDMRHPCVDVRDCGFDARVAHYGEMNAVLGRAKGVTGAVIDGGIRDSGLILKMDFPCFRRYHSPVEAVARWSYYRWQQPITLRGNLSATVTVNPGDFMFGDIDGVLVIPKERAIEVLRLAEEHAATETRARADFADPANDAEEVYGRYKKL